MRTCRFVLIALWLAGGFAMAQPSKEAARPPDLTDIQNRYLSVHSVAMKATGRVRVGFKDAGPPAIANFSISYWAEGSNYRLNYNSNGVQGLIGSVQIAKDGQISQQFDQENLILSFTTRDVKDPAVPGPNPFFLPLLFLAPDGAQCPDCAIRLLDLRESTQWQAAQASDRARNVVSIKARSPQDPWAYEVTLGRVGGSVVPLVVQRRDRRGRVLAEVTSKDFRDFGPPVGMVPMTIDTQTFLEDGATDSQGTWKVTYLQMNGVIDPSLFRLSQDEAQIVINDDTGVFLKHWKPELVGHSMKEFAPKVAVPDFAPKAAVPDKVE